METLVDELPVLFISVFFIRVFARASVNSLFLVLSVQRHEVNWKE